jgi:shikimate 5-dehydrogenase
MLVNQAAESFRLWTGQEADRKLMLEAGRKALLT